MQKKPWQTWQVWAGFFMGAIGWALGYFNDNLKTFGLPSVAVSILSVVLPIVLSYVKAHWLAKQDPTAMGIAAGSAAAKLPSPPGYGR